MCWIYCRIKENDASDNYNQEVEVHRGLGALPGSPLKIPSEDKKACGYHLIETFLIISLRKAKISPVQVSSILLLSTLICCFSVDFFV